MLHLETEKIIVTKKVLGKISPILDKILPANSICVSAIAIKMAMEKIV
jgi:hypothetical protein